jgi:hypothetical protein
VADPLSSPDFRTLASDTWHIQRTGLTTRNTDLPPRAFQRCPIPIGKLGRRVICAVEKAQERLLWVGCIPEDAVGQQKLPHRGVKKGFARRDGL